MTFVFMEIYYIIISLTIYLPNLIKNNEIKSSTYVHDYYFHPTNNNLYNHKNNLFSIIYQKHLLKTSVFYYNYYTITR